MTKSLPKLVVLLGPTASGKSAMAIELAKEFNGEIISADSRNIYRGMDIGTAKPKGKWDKIDGVEAYVSEGIAHHMVDVVNPDNEYTVAQYKKEVEKIIKKIVKRGNLPIMVGGTGLYIEAVVDNLTIPEVPPDKKLRDKLEERMEKKGLEALWKDLLAHDPDAEFVVQKDNPRRIIRALEVSIKAGKPFTSFRKKGKPKFEVLQLGVQVPREELYKRIDKRVDEQVKAGLIKETKFLSKRFSWDLTSMSGLGYKQIGMFLRGEIEEDEAIELDKRDTRRYARRQITWFKRDKRIKWITNITQARKQIKQFLKK